MQRKTKSDVLPLPSAGQVDSSRTSGERGVHAWTPGPWSYQEESDVYTHIVRKGNLFIVQLGQDATGKAEATARLIAASPEMYDMLSEVLDYLPDRLGDKVRGVLAKANPSPLVREGAVDRQSDVEAHKSSATSSTEGGKS